MAGTQTTANWAELLKPDLKELAINGYDNTPSLYPKLFKTDKTTKGFEEYKNVDTVGYPVRTAETVTTTKTAPVDGYRTRITAYKFKQGVDVSEEMINRQQYDLFMPSTMGMGEAAKQFKDVKAFANYRNAWTVAKSSYGDAVAYFSTAHPTKLTGGTAQSNASATGIPLTNANLGVGLKALWKQTNYSEKLLNFLNKKVILMVTPDNWINAFEIIKSTMKSDTAENTTNFFYNGIQMELMVNPYISSQVGAEDGDTAGIDTHWFLICSDIVQNVMLEEKGLNFSDKFDPENDVMNFYAKENFGVGAKHYIGQWGSKGDSQVYTGY